MFIYSAMDTVMWSILNFNSFKQQVGSMMAFMLWNKKFVDIFELKVISMTDFGMDLYGVNKSIFFS